MRIMRNKNDWMQKKSIIIILVVLLLVAILAVAAELGMKSGGRPNKIIEKITNGNNNEDNSNSDSNNMKEKDSEKEFEDDTNSELNTGYGYEMDVLPDKNNSTEEKTVYEKGYDLPVDKQEDKTAKKELHEMMQAVWPIYDKSEKGDTSNVVLPSKTIKKMHIIIKL